VGLLSAWAEKPSHLGAGQGAGIERPDCCIYTTIWLLLAVGKKDATSPDDGHTDHKTFRAAREGILDAWS